MVYSNLIDDSGKLYDTRISHRPGRLPARPDACGLDLHGLCAYGDAILETHEVEVDDARGGP